MTFKHHLVVEKTSKRNAKRNTMPLCKDKKCYAFSFSSGWQRWTSHVSKMCFLRLVRCRDYFIWSFQLRSCWKAWGLHKDWWFWVMDKKNNRDWFWKFKLSNMHIVQKIHFYWYHLACLCTDLSSLWKMRYFHSFL